MRETLINNFIRIFICCLLLAGSNGVFADPFFSWKPGKYIWNLGISISCDVKPEGDLFEADPCSYINPDYLKDGDTVWVRSCNLPIFVSKILPKIHNRIILVVNDGDEGIPSDVLTHQQEKELIQNEKIIHFFAQNCTYRGPYKLKVSPMPIGIDYHTLELRPRTFYESYQRIQDQEDTLDAVLADLLPTKDRKKGAVIDFHLNNSSYKGKFGETRMDIANFLKAKEDLRGVLHFLNTPIPRRDLWKEKGKYAFSISPHGNGLDCHRTWEDLLLGCIVIVKTSELDSLYEGLPVVIVNSWSEITPANLDKWLLMYGDAFTNLEYRKKLTHEYWLEKIRSYKYVTSF